MKCRVLYLVGQLGPGGSERQLYYLLLAMDRERYKPAVAVWNYSENDVYVPQIRALGVPVFSFPNAGSAAAKLRVFCRLVRHIDPEIVHSYSSYTNFGAWLATRSTPVIAIGSVRSDFDRARNAAGPWLGRLNSRWPRTQIFNSITAAETSRCSGSMFVPKRLFVVPNMLDLKLFQSVSTSTEAPIRISGVGSLLPVKRWDRLLRAALGLKRNGLDCLIQIAGDGPLRASLEQQAQELGVAGRVKFLGQTDNVPSLLANTAFLVHTSDSEGCPNAVMEAMASGRAVIATDAGDIPFLVEDGKTGFVVRRGNDAALVERMATLITNRNLSKRMGEAGRAKAEREFGLDRLVSETLAVYRSAGWKESHNDVEY